MKTLILVGGGGHCKSVIEAIESSGREVAGILDIAQNVGNYILGYEILGTDDDILKYVNEYEFVITVGNIKDNSLRRRIAQKIIAEGGVLTTVVANTARISRHAKIGLGTVVLHGAVINAGAIVGENCIINTLANIEHDAIIEDFCHISTGAMVNGNCFVGEGTFLGSQAVMVNGVSITGGCVIAAGAMVRKNIVRKGVYSDNPAVLKIKL